MNVGNGLDRSAFVVGGGVLDAPFICKRNE